VTLATLLERHAELEKRGMSFYRALADRFAFEIAAARLWRELSDTEASHFALLELAQDWSAAAGPEQTARDIAGDHLEGIGERMREIEEAAGRASTTLVDAVELSILWEELELPRILDLLQHLPDKARSRVLAGMVGELTDHYRVLVDRARAAGAPGNAARVSAMAERARSALG
jgi:rubrerythrin